MWACLSGSSSFSLSRACPLGIMLADRVERLARTARHNRHAVMRDARISHLVAMRVFSSGTAVIVALISHR